MAQSSCYQYRGELARAFCEGGGQGSSGKRLFEMFQGPGPLGGFVEGFESGSRMGLAEREQALREEFAREQMRLLREQQEQLRREREAWEQMKRERETWEQRQRAERELLSLTPEERERRTPPPSPPPGTCVSKRNFTVCSPPR
jgi:hypothetical protein